MWLSHVRVAANFRCLQHEALAAHQQVLDPMGRDRRKDFVPLLPLRLAPLRTIAGMAHNAHYYGGNRENVNVDLGIGRDIIQIAAAVGCCVKEDLAVCEIAFSIPEELIASLRVPTERAADELLNVGGGGSCSR